MWRQWSCLCYCQNRPAGNPHGPYGRPGVQGHHVGDPALNLPSYDITHKKPEIQNFPKCLKCKLEDLLTFWGFEQLPSSIFW